MAKDAGGKPERSDIKEAREGRLPVTDALDRSGLENGRIGKQPLSSWKSLEVKCQRWTSCGVRQ